MARRGAYKFKGKRRSGTSNPQNFPLRAQPWWARSGFAWASPGYLGEHSEQCRVCDFTVVHEFATLFRIMTP